MSSKRRGEITRLLQDEGTISIADLAQKLGVSLETIRRDVKPMTRCWHQFTRVHGAVGLPQHLGEAPFELRMRENADAKRTIAAVCSANDPEWRVHHAGYGDDDKLSGARTSAAPQSHGR